MELSFQTHHLPYLKTILREVRYQEETAESIVPDSYPDMEQIVDSFAFVILRGKDCRTGSCSVSGGIKGGILYQSEDETQLRTLDFYLPFNLKADHPELTPESKLCCDIRVRSVDGKMINSRKAMLRVNISCLIFAYENQDVTYHTLDNRPDAVQVLERTYPLQFPVEYSEKSCAIHEIMELPTDHAEIGQVYKLICRPDLSDQKIVGNKAVFRGNLFCKMSYLSGEGNYCVHSMTVPFSQYCQLEQEYDDEEVLVIPIVTGCDLSLEGEDNGRKGEIAVHLLVQCVVTGVREVTLIEDAYCTNGALQMKMKEYHFESILDRQKLNVSLHQKIESELSQVIDTEIYTDFPVVSAEQELSPCQIVTVGHAIGYDLENKLIGASGIGSACVENPVSGQVGCVGRIVRNSENYAIQIMNKVEICQDIQVEMQFIGGQKLCAAVEAEYEPESEKMGYSSSLILKRIPEETTLWELAKACKSRVDTIREVNQLEDHRVDPEQMLLIPVG